MEKYLCYTNKPAPNSDPMLYATPSGEAEDTTAVTRSPAPFASANNVTPPTTSDNPNHPLIYIIDSAIYSSTRSQINLNIKKINSSITGIKSHTFPFNEHRNNLKKFINSSVSPQGPAKTAHFSA